MVYLVKITKSPKGMSRTLAAIASRPLVIGRFATEAEAIDSRVSIVMDSACLVQDGMRVPGS